MPTLFQTLLLTFFNIHIVFQPISPSLPPQFPFVRPVILSATPIPTTTPSPTPSPTQNPNPTPSPTVIPTTTPSPTPTPPPPSSSPIPTSSPTPIPSSSPTPLPTPSPSPSASETPTPSPTPSPTPTPTPPPPSPTPTPHLGNDISYPQCNKNYPVGQSFGIVGINGGIASTTNPCLASQLSWAASTPDSNVNQAKIQLYVNTGNPGGLGTVTWPQNNTDPQGNETSNPYGNCDGANSISCAWQYGWNRAVDDVLSRFTPAASTAGISTDPTKYPWWLDVETANSWREGSDEALAANAADLEGMVAYFKSRGISLGLYSTSFQWGKIVGNLSSESSLHGLPNWLPGASDLEGAIANCQKPPFTLRSEVTLTQFTTGEFDYDYSCK